MYKFYITVIIGAIFGYIWMLSIPLVLFFVLMALFFSWSWSNVFTALIVGAIAKWLLRGFRDTSQRIKVEHHLVKNHGYTFKQARHLWALAYENGGPDGYLRVLEIYGLSAEQLAKTKEFMEVHSSTKRNALE